MRVRKNFQSKDRCTSCNSTDVKLGYYNYEGNYRLCVICKKCGDVIRALNREERRSLMRLAERERR